MLSWKRDRGPLEGGRLETPGLEGWGQGHPTPWASSGQKSAPAVPLRLVLLDWVRPCQETSKAAVAGSLPKSSGRRTSQPGGKTGQTCASLSALAALLLTGWQTHCSPGRPAAGRPPPPPFLQPAGRASQPATLHSREAPAWSLALPELWTTPARTVSVGGMNEAGCRCRKALYLLPCGGSLGAVPWDRKAAGMWAGVRSQRGRRAGIKPRLRQHCSGLRDLPSSSYLAGKDRQLDGLWKFTLPRLSHCRESMAPPRWWDLRGFIQAEAFQSGTRALSQGGKGRNLSEWN